MFQADPASETVIERGFGVGFSTVDDKFAGVAAAIKNLGIHADGHLVTSEVFRISHICVKALVPLGLACFLQTLFDTQIEVVRSSTLIAMKIMECFLSSCQQNPRLQDYRHNEEQGCLQADVQVVPESFVLLSRHGGYTFSEVVPDAQIAR